MALSMPPLTRALVRRPSLRLAEGELTHLSRTPVDVPLAFAQHAAYLALLAQHGVVLIELPELPDYPDGLFVEDIVVCVDDRLVLTRPGAASRRGEVDSAEATLQTLGLSGTRIAAPATLDGGDVLVLDRHVLVGRSTRSNDAAHEQLSALLHGSRRSVVSVDVRGALHLKTGLTRLPDGSLIAYADFVDTSLLEALGYRVLCAPESSGSDVLCLGDCVVLPSDAQQTAADLKQHSYNVECIDISELQKLEAGVTCMSVFL